MGNKYKYKIDQMRFLSPDHQSYYITGEQVVNGICNAADYGTQYVQVQVEDPITHELVWITVKMFDLFETEFDEDVAPKKIIKDVEGLFNWKIGGVSTIPPLEPPIDSTSVQEFIYEVVEFSETDKINFRNYRLVLKKRIDFDTGQFITQWAIDTANTEFKLHSIGISIALGESVSDTDLALWTAYKDYKTAIKASQLQKMKDWWVVDA